MSDTSAAASPATSSSPSSSSSRPSSDTTASASSSSTSASPSPSIPPPSTPPHSSSPSSLLPPSDDSDLSSSPVTPPHLLAAIEAERQSQMDKSLQSNRLSSSRRKSINILLESQSEEFQQKWKQHNVMGDSIQSPEEAAEYAEAAKKITVEAQKIIEQKELNDEMKEEEKFQAAERERIAKEISLQVSKEQEERVKEHLAGLDSRKISESRRISVSLLLESRSEEYQTKKLLNKIMGECLVDPNEEEEWEDQKQHRESAITAIVMEREEQERRKSEARQEEQLSLEERKQMIKKVNEMEEKEKEERVKEFQSGKDDNRRRVSLLVANSVKEQLAKHGEGVSGQSSLRSSRANSRRGSFSKSVNPNGIDASHVEIDAQHPHHHHTDSHGGLSSSLSLHQNSSPLSIVDLINKQKDHLHHAQTTVKRLSILEVNSANITSNLLQFQQQIKLQKQQGSLSSTSSPSSPNGNGGISSSSPSSPATAQTSKGSISLESKSPNK